MSLTFSRSLVDLVRGLRVLTAEKLEQLAGTIEVRLKALENQRADFDAAVDGLQRVGLDRINVVLTPAIQSVLAVQERGYMLATSASSATIGLNDTVILLIDDEQERALFAPSPRVFLSRAGSDDDYAIARLETFNRESGDFVCVVEASWGDPGPHDDWQISALAGSPYAAIKAAEDAAGSRDLAGDWAEKASGADVDGVGTRSAKHHALAAGTSATAAATSAGAALASAGVADGRADDADTSASFAAGKADEAAASALAAATSAASVDGTAIDSRLDALEAAMPTKAPQATTYTKDETDARIEAAGGQILAWMKFKQVETL